MYNIEVRRIDDDKWRISAYSFYCGIIIDTREDDEIGNAGERQASFTGGVALFRDDEPFAAVDLLNMQRKLDRDDEVLELTTVDFAHSGELDDAPLWPGDSAEWEGYALVQIVVENPSEWWVGALSYIGYGTDNRPWKASIKTVSTYDITENEDISIYKSLYYEENVWNQSHVRTGVMTDWPE